uniref:Wall-associated receptor kinase-like 16 n=1 Tax=Nelumbo nucifera TaxID=4432 RepID=A0A822ZGM8_NELNU|nr:TPA_asm: hypothetical protein HUJ06_000805 [Nelumbo nucifera]
MALTVLLLLLLQLHFLWPAPATVAISSTPSVVKPGCQVKCGNITVPYPFGLRDGDPSCYREGFNLICDHASTPPKLFVRVSEDRDHWKEVIDISLVQGQLRIYSVIEYACYDRSGKVNSSNSFFGFRRLALPFSFSQTRNRYTVIGCDADARMTDYIPVGNSPTGVRFSTWYTYGCANDRENMTLLTNGTCTESYGCCQMNIPKGVKTFDSSINTRTPNEPDTDVLDANPCKYHFLVDYEWYNYFSVADIRGFDFYTRNGGKVPVVLDWAIERFWCENASTTDPNYACRGNHSECLNSPSGWGYLCNCSQGYLGNPYLDDGCQDIDECAKPESHDCTEQAVCTNTPGSFKCTCPPGTEGDGKRKGQGCIPLPPSRTKLLVTQVLIGVGLGAVFILASYWLYQVFKKKQIKNRKESYFKRNGGLLLHQQVSTKEGNVEKIKIFSAEELERATDQYNEDRILGQGGQGTVYKGMLQDGRIVAIKKSKIVDESQLEQFINEVIILSQINHRNVVKLLGCCLEVEIPLLVYEFISGGTLSHNIHHYEDFPLSWDNRLRIATEVAGAIAYLHSAAAVPIYHRDIKSSNILLDDKGRVKVSDFGTSRSVEIDKTHLTTIVQGTFGYLDPEYFQSSQFTDKSDVYSFGVVLVELLTGEKPISSTRQAEGKNLVTYFVSKMEENHLFEILDAHVINEGKKEELQKIADLAKRCLNLKRKKRPTMKEVALKLEGLRSFAGHSQIQRNTEEVEYMIDEPYGLWSATSTSTGHTSLENDIISQLEEKPLLVNSSS